MPHRVFNLEEVARHLHLPKADVERLVKNQDIPFEKRGGRLVFRKVDIEAWASQRILGLEGRGLADFHQRSSREVDKLLPHQAIMPDLLSPAFINPALPAKTKASVLREMAALANRTGRVSNPEGLLEGLRAREELCSTGLPGGLALLHPRYPDPYLFETPFLVLGRTVQEIPFGAPDGRATDLFFLIACPDERLHLHTLARLCMMAVKTQFLADLRQANGAEAMHTVVLAAEGSVLASVRPIRPA